MSNNHNMEDFSQEEMDRLLGVLRRAVGLEGDGVAGFSFGYPGAWAYITQEYHCPPAPARVRSQADLHCMYRRMTKSDGTGEGGMLSDNQVKFRAIRDRESMVVSGSVHNKGKSLSEMKNEETFVKGKYSHADLLRLKKFVEKLKPTSPKDQSVWCQIELEYNEGYTRPRPMTHLVKRTYDKGIVDDLARKAKRAKDDLDDAVKKYKNIPLSDQKALSKAKRKKCRALEKYTKASALLATMKDLKMLVLKLTGGKELGNGKWSTPNADGRPVAAVTSPDESDSSTPVSQSDASVARSVVHDVISTPSIIPAVSVEATTSESEVGDTRHGSGKRPSSHKDPERNPKPPKRLRGAQRLKNEISKLNERMTEFTQSGPPKWIEEFFKNVMRMPNKNSTKISFKDRVNDARAMKEMGVIGEEEYGRAVAKIREDYLKQIGTG